MDQEVVFNLAGHTFQHARQTPDRLALVVDEREYTYADLATAAARVAAWLRERIGAGSAQAGPRVGILAARSFETYAGILGVAWAGGTYVPLNPKQPASRISYVIGRAGLAAVIADTRGSAHLPDLAETLPPHVLTPREFAASNISPHPSHQLTAWESLPQLSGALPAPTNVGPDHPAYVIFTSGTTGVPKGVAVSVSNVAHFLAAMRTLYHLTPADRIAQFFETSFDVSVSEMFACWDAGATLYTMPETKMMAPGGFLKQYEITFWQSVPSAILTMSRVKQITPGAFPSMRVSIFGGEGVSVDLLKLWQTAAPNSIIENQYGPTEATVACLSQRFTDPPIETPGRGTLSIGEPFPQMHAAILGPDGAFLGDEQTGELAVTGPQVALGYFGDDAMTARRFPTLDHPTLGRTRWYLTGDLAFRDAGGHFHCLGRIDHQVKVMGHRVELEEVEAHLREVCKTQAVAAIGWPLVNGNPAGIVGFVSGSALAPAAVRDELRQRVPNYMIPAKVLPLDALPLSTNGKVDRHALKNMLDAESVSI